jgi:hypothetical protein
LFRSSQCNNPLLQQAPFIAGLTFNDTSLWHTQLAAFMAVRGAFAWLGWSQWGMVWPTAASASLPRFIDADWGRPVSACRRTGRSTFQRRYQLATFDVDCSTFTSVVTAAVR